MPKQKKIYFQWQNEALMRTIYPLRTMNLRNALEYYMEIDLWKRYDGKKIEDLPQDVENYHKKKAAVIQQAKLDYESLLDYFFDFDPEQDPELVNSVDNVMLAKVKKPHVEFKEYYGYRVDENDKRKKISDPFRQSYFISQRLETLDKDRKELDQQIVRQTRRLAAIKLNNPDLPEPTEEKTKLQKLQNAVPLFEKQRGKLTALLTAFGRIESRRRDYIKQRDAAVKRQKEIGTKQSQEQARLKTHTTRLGELQEEEKRLRPQLEPATVDNYIADPDSLTEMAHRFPQADPDFCRQVDALREEIASLESLELVRTRLKGHISTLLSKRSDYEARADPKFKENTLKAYDEVLGHMKEYLSLLDGVGRNLGVLEKALKKIRQDIHKVQEKLQEILEKVNDFLKQLDGLGEILHVTEDAYVYQYRRVPPELKDIVNLKLDEYRESLLAGDKDKDPFTYQFFLLGLLIERFKREPKRFPRWLQYMIVHFSGMRYASAHGSWADPKDLYLTLQISLINNKLLDDIAIEEICRQKIADYTGKPGFKAGRGGDDSRRARTKDNKFREKVDGHLARMGEDDPHERRQGLLNLLLDEENYDLETMSDQDALDALEDLQKKGLIPGWMWKEISAMTDLRLKEVQDVGWEKLTDDQRKEKNEAKWAKYREIMNDWKKEYLTGWRKEHEGNIQNLVSRAVCNEVAEHILHLRGLEGAAGLSSLADMYTREGIKPKGSPGQAEAGKDAAYFVKSKKAEDFCPGAGILWLKYRNDKPPQWNEVKPFKTLDGDKTLPDEYIKGGRWNYKDKDGLVRTRKVPGAKGGTINVTQYLFWVHIATVAEVAKTGAETAVLTFETSLPYEDRRLACVGVFKRALHNLTHDGWEDTYNGAFVGYVPDNPAGIPKKDLDEMLNWDHVLLKSKANVKDT